MRPLSFANRSFSRYDVEGGRLLLYFGDVPNSIKSKLLSFVFHDDEHVFVGVSGCIVDKVLLAEKADYDS